MLQLKIAVRTLWYVNQAEYKKRGTAYFIWSVQEQNKMIKWSFVGLWLARMRVSWEGLGVVGSARYEPAQ